MGSVLNSAEWGDVPLALRERAFFSAEVEKLRLLQRMQDRVQTAIGMLRRPGEGADGGDGAFQTREKFIAEMRQLAREEGLDPRSAPTRENVFAGRPEALGTMKDITSERRLKLIYDVQTEIAAEYARWKAEQDPAVLAAFPAQEFVRIKAVKRARQDWPERWKKAGGKIIQGRLVALKNDPVWRKLSRFGTPYPPFDFGSGMGLRDLSRRDAEALGIIAPGDPPPTGAEEDFNQELQASVADLNPAYREGLSQTFGDLIDIRGDEVKWVGLSSGEQQSLHRYTEGEASIYRQLNRELRDGDPSPEMRAQAEALDAVLQKLPKVEGEVYRGEERPLEDLDWYEQNIGALDERPAFTSSTQGRAETYPGNARFVIQSKSGRRIAVYSAKPGQQEVLFGTGTKFRITAVERDGDHATIWLEEP